MKYLQLLSLLIVSASFSLSPAFAGGNDPDVSKPSSQEKGTNVRGESSDFKDYLNEGEQTKDSNSIDLVDLGEDAKVAVGGDDPSVGVRMGY